MTRRMVACPGAASEWGLSFEAVGGSDTPLTESNKAEFFTRKVQYELRGKRCSSATVPSVSLCFRAPELQALREGFVEAQQAIGLANHMELLSYSVGLG